MASGLRNPGRFSVPTFEPNEPARAVPIIIGHLICPFHTSHRALCLHSSYICYLDFVLPHLEQVARCHHSSVLRVPPWGGLKASFSDVKRKVSANNG